MIRVLVVDDSAFMRMAISRALSSEKDIEVVATGRNGLDAVELNERHAPDVVTLDVEMPSLDGLGALERIMKSKPTRVLMISSLTSSGSDAAIRALSLGAADVMPKDDLSAPGLLLAKVRALAGSRYRPGPTKSASAGQSVAPDQTAKRLSRSTEIICIGSSTGGPAVLESILKSIPAGFRPSVVVAQHMPAMFTASMAQRLGEVCSLPVLHVDRSAIIAPGTIYIAKGGSHMQVRQLPSRRAEAYATEEPADALYRPSADALVASVSAIYRSRAAAIILSGIGADGLEGCRALHAAGGLVLAQNEETCVVYGMPKSVVSAGIANAHHPVAIAQMLKTLHADQTRAAA
ncbi:MAG: chemotaxis-specific protein-glutamate methyltransferase CheB [Phycisphaeraceae bacterium]|nr:MAG: chemotaxis-specific protein-glutamate methyltransferase CheB [Phycisphaeraceae bacterium]